MPILKKRENTQKRDIEEDWIIHHIANNSSSLFELLLG